MRGCKLEASRVVVDDLVVLLNRAVIILLRVGNFTQPELRVGRQVRVAVILQVILKFRMRQVVFAACQIAETIGVKCVRRRSRTRRPGAGREGGGAWTRSSTSDAGGRRGLATGEPRVDILHGVLQVDQLLIQLAKARLDLL